MPGLISKAILDSDAWKVLMVMMDKNTRMNEATLRSMTTSLEEMGVFIIPVGMGREINIVEYYYLTAYRDFVTFSSDYTSISYLTIGENIMNRFVRCKCTCVFTSFIHCCFF